jgi:hypothetical protein
MAVFQAARLRNAALPAPAYRTRRHSSAVISTHVTPGVRPAGLLMAAILVSTMLGLAYLTQTLGTSATGSAVQKLESTARGLDTKLSVQSAQVADLTEADVVIANARQQGLRKLDDEIKLVLRAP